MLLIILVCYKLSRKKNNYKNYNNNFPNYIPSYWKKSDCQIKSDYETKLISIKLIKNFLDKTGTFQFKFNLLNWNISNEQNISFKYKLFHI